MKSRYFFSLILSMCLFTLSGCGGGSGGGNNGAGPTTTVSGVASKGIFTAGQVKVYALNVDGSKGALLKTASINGDGSYSANIGAYTGAVITEASGSYRDEATGATMQVTDASPLRAAVQNASGDLKMAITPLTEIAVRKVEDPTSGKIAVASVDASNAGVANAFHIADIITTQPIDATVAAPAAATQTQKEYSLALAALSQMMQTNGQNLTAVVSQVAGAVTGTGTGAALAASAAVDFQSALLAFVSDAAKNKTGINDVSATALTGVGATTATVRVSTQGSATALNGIQVTLALPAGVTVKAASAPPATGLAPLAGLVSVSGVAPAASTLVSRYVPANSTAFARLSLGLVSTASFPVGEFATIICDVAPGTSIGGSSFTSASYSGFKVVDDTGATISGITFSAEVR